MICAVVAFSQDIVSVAFSAELAGIPCEEAPLSLMARVRRSLKIETSTYSNTSKDLIVFLLVLLIVIPGVSDFVKAEIVPGRNLDRV